MSTPLSKQTLKRMAWLAALEDPKNLTRQTRRCYRKAGGKVCAVGLLMELEGTDHPHQVAPIINALTMGDVQYLNDTERMTFPQIAACLRRLWKL